MNFNSFFHLCNTRTIRNIRIFQKLKAARWLKMLQHELWQEPGGKGDHMPPVLISHWLLQESSWFPTILTAYSVSPSLRYAALGLNYWGIPLIYSLLFHVTNFFICICIFLSHSLWFSSLPSFSWYWYSRFLSIIKSGHDLTLWSASRSFILGYTNKTGWKWTD